MQNNNKTTSEIQDNKITITLEDGTVKNGEIIFTFESNGDDYVLYELDDKAFAAKIDENNKLTPIEEDE
jgi:hypothetical protein